MKVPHSIFAVLASVGLVSAVQFTEIAACGQQCYNSVKNDFTVYGCASATDLACLCANRNYSNGIKDCANQSCLGADAASAGLIQTYANDECAAFGAGQPQPNPTFTDGAPPASTSVTPETTTPLGTITSVAPTEQSPVSTTTNQAAAATTQDINSPTISTTLVIVTTSNSASAAATSAATSSSSSSSSDSDSDANSSADSGSKSSDAESSSSDTETESGGHLGNSAKIGIGVGAGAVAVVFAALLFALCRRRRDNKRMIISNKSDLEISLPLPGSGRTYAADDISSPRSVVALIKGAGRSELELNSTRYENMIPRTQPSLTRVR